MTKPLSNDIRERLLSAVDDGQLERMFGRIKDFRRFAKRYERLGQNFLETDWLAAVICY